MTFKDIKVMPYNEAPEAKEIYHFLKETGIDEVFEVADAKREYWKNDHATLVLRVKQLDTHRTLTFKDGEMIARLAWKFKADEFNSVVEDYVTYYRIWWD